MAIISLPNTFSANTTISSSEVNANFSTIYNEFNGSIAAANLATDSVTTAKIADSAVTTAKIADDNITAAKIDWASTGSNAGIWWEELGRTTLGSAGDTITVSGLPARKYLAVIMTLPATGGTVSPQFRFNNDSATNYARRASADGGAESTITSATVISAGSSNSSFVWGSAEIINVSSIQKFVQGRIVLGDTAAGTAPSRNEFTGKWVNTADAITRIDLINNGTGNFAIGSEVVVLGHD